MQRRQVAKKVKAHQYEIEGIHMPVPLQSLEYAGHYRNQYERAIKLATEATEVASS